MIIIMGEDEEVGPINEEKGQEEIAKESPTEQAEERPIGVEEQKTIEEQEKGTEQSEPTTKPIRNDSKLQQKK
jgi:hypothetical protein